MSRSGLVLLIWGLSVVLSVTVIVFRVSFSYDLGVLLPEPGNESEQLLVEQVGQSPGARLLFVAVGQDSQPRLETLIQALDQSKYFSRVMGGGRTVSTDDIPELIHKNRYLLDQRPLQQELLLEQFDQRASELRMLAGRSFAQMVASDPTLATLAVLDNASEFAGDGSDWKTARNESVIIVETAAAAFDLEQQRQAVMQLQAIVSEVLETPDPPVRITGIGYIGTRLEAQIRREAQTRSLLASIVLVLILVIAYRRFAEVVLAGLPLISGGLIALAVLAVLTDSVHGITLAFGFTLLGIGIDYPVHYFSHSRHQPPSDAIARIWPTLRLGIISTLVAYMALILTGSEGTRQLGIFTSVGLVAIALVTRFVLPVLHGSLTRPDASAISPNDDAVIASFRLRWLPLIVAAFISISLVFLTWSGRLFDDDLSRLSPLPDALLKTDRDLRSAAGSPDARFLVAVRAEQLEQVLQSTENLDRQLKLASQPAIKDWFVVTSLLPSQLTQQKRQDALPATDTLRSWTIAAAESAGLNSELFVQFEDDVGIARQSEFVGVDDYDETVFESLVGAHLYKAGGDWVSVTSLHGVEDSETLSEQLALADGFVVDLKRASESLVHSYRQAIGFVLAIALIFIIGLLVWRTSLRRGVWVISTALIAVLCAVAFVYLTRGPLDLYHLMALLLVAGLVLDYALFLSKTEAGRQKQDTDHAVLTCAASTVATFSILAFSTIPALSSLGTVVAVGALSGFLIAWLATRISTGQSLSKVAQ